MLTPDEQVQIDTLKRRLRERHAAIAADPNLSPAGKRARRAREQLAAEQVHKQIIEASDARHQRAMKDAHRRNFGVKVSSADGILADRDARQFAAALKNPGDAMKALAAAELRGDTSLARAIAERAWNTRGADPSGQWNEVVTAYAAADPSRNASLGEYAELAGHDSAEARLADSLYRHLPRPDDLQRWGTLESIAASTPTAAGAT